jgi:hypothetical protein
VGPVRLDRTAGTNQSGQVGLTGQPRQVDLDKAERTRLSGHDNKDRTAASGELWTRLPGKAAGIKQLGQDSRDRTARLEQP